MLDTDRRRTPPTLIQRRLTRRIVILQHHHLLTHRTHNRNRIGHFLLLHKLPNLFLWDHVKFDLWVEYTAVAVALVVPVEGLGFGDQAVAQGAGLVYYLPALEDGGVGERGFRGGWGCDRGGVGVRVWLGVDADCALLLEFYQWFCRVCVKRIDVPIAISEIYAIL